MSLLQVRGLSLALAGRSLLQGLDWSVQPGELWCLLGPNGAGKTTLLHTLCGLRQPSAGSIEIDGLPLAGTPLPLLARLRGFMPQQQFDAFSHSVLDTVLVGRTPYRLGRHWDSAQDLATARAALQRVGLAGYEARDVMGLSGGERQRVALAALLAQAPKLMLLDEPASHQDVAHQLGLMRLLRELLPGHAVVMTCHDINLAARYASHVLMLSGGRHWLGTAASVLTVGKLEAAFSCRFETDGRLFLPADDALPG
jgi:iron complex transport system ATP-binding protein